MKRFALVFSALSLSCLSFAGPIPAQQYLKRPKLVLLLVVDQFRSDYLTRFHSRFLPSDSNGTVGGYRYLMTKGAYFPFAEYSNLQCMTGPGHAMISTGALPYQLGMPINFWFEKGEKTYCVQDSDVKIVGSTSDKVTERGMSPKILSTSTFGDELKNSGHPSKVFAVALKDRSAILMGGRRADLATWFDASSWRWVTSTFYRPDNTLPSYLIDLNAKLAKEKGKKYEWKATGPATGLSVNDPSGFTKTIEIGSKESVAFPLGMEITIDAAETHMKSNQMGKDATPDVLAVSLSSHDYMAHQYGPNTRELEEMTVQEDRLISKLLNSVKAQVPGGLSEVVIVLTADHGGAHSPVWMKTQRMNAGTIDSEEILKETEKELVEEYGKPLDGDRWLPFHNDLNYFISEKSTREKKVNRVDIEARIKTRLLKHPGVAFAFTRSDIEKGLYPPGDIGRRVSRTYVPGRSGDVVAIPKPFWFEDTDPVGHMTGYAYDRMVPLVFVGTNIKAGVYSTKSDPIDIAPTLSFILGVTAPAASEGRILHEIF